MSSSMFERIWSTKATRIASISLAILASLLVSTSFVHAQNPDFTISANPANLCGNPGINASSAITVSSVGGFAGTIHLGGSVDPSVSNSPTLSGVPSSETLAAGQTVTFDVTILTTDSTPAAIYYVTVSGLSGSTFHQATVQFTVGAGCSVGGTVLPVDRLAVIAPYLTIGAATVAIAGLAIGVMVYRARHK